MGVNIEDELTLRGDLAGILVKKKQITLMQTPDNELVVYAARSLAAEAGFNQTDEFVIATAASELATNILRYAGGGEMEISIVLNGENRKGIALFATDKGPGIIDISLAMCEQFSSLENSLGLGLPSVKRMMDEFSIESIKGKGTRVLAVKWNHDDRC